MVGPVINRDAVAAIATVFLLSGEAVVAGTLEGVSAFRRGHYAEAVKELGPAADAGDAEALFVLGQMHSAGKGVPRDQAKATEYFAKAAERGSPADQQSYGEALMLGDGVKQDMLQALKWFIVSARAGNKEAAAYANRVGKFMAREKQLEARVMANEWQQRFDAGKAAGGRKN